MSFSLDRWKNKICVVTGASSGIGAKVAEELAFKELIVVAVARRKEKLAQLYEHCKSKNCKLHVFTADVTKESEILNLFDWVKQKLGPIAILVNCAGIGRYARLVDGETRYWKEILDTNVLGLCIATREAVKCMRENNLPGHIIHINSTSGHGIEKAWFNVYSASKYAVTALTETLRQELNSVENKIKVTSISPGLVATEMHTAAAVASGKPDIVPSIESWLNTKSMLEAKDIADAVIYVLSTPPHVQVNEIIITPLNRL